jgi:hypothetical protein
MTHFALTLTLAALVLLVAVAVLNVALDAACLPGCGR